MIAHGLAPPYPDELAYSIIARSLKRWRYAHNQSLLRTLFEGEPSAIDPVSPPRLAAVAKAYGFASARTFAARHTLLPYYLAFVPERQRLSALRTLLAEKQEAAASQLPRTRPPAALEPSFLRCCSDCVHLDLVRYGETYWHRAHQLPAISRCVRHDCSLRWTTVLYRPNGPADYWAATASGLLRSQTERCVSPIGMPLADRINRQSVGLLSGFGKGSEDMTRVAYKDALNRAGYVVAQTGRVNVPLFDEHFGKFLGSSGPKARSIGLGRWWLQAARPSSRHHLAPVQHLLLREFLRNREATADPLPYRALDPHVTFTGPKDERRAPQLQSSHTDRK